MIPRTIYPSVIDLTLGISCAGNKTALLLCLSSVLNAQAVPAQINIRIEGPLPMFDDFTLEQLALLAQIRGSNFSIQRAKSSGIRAARNAQMDQCRTNLLWMLDDDVVPDYDCLKAFEEVIHSLAASSAAWAYLAGVKVDISNRRGYPDFDTSVRTIPRNSVSQNHFFDKASVQGKAYLWSRLDCGNVILNLPLLRSKGLNFSPLGDAGNVGGEDEVFGLAVDKAGCNGFVALAAQSVHFDKPKPIFGNEAGQRKEMLRLAKKLFSNDS